MADLAASLAKIRHHVTSKLDNQKAPAQLLIALEATLAEQSKQGAAASASTSASASAPAPSNASQHAKPHPPPAEYFLALETIIPKAMDKQSPATLLPSVIYLLSLVSPHVSPAVLKARLGSLLPALSSILSNPHGSLAITSSSPAAQTAAIENHAALLRSALAVLQSLFLALSYHSSDRSTLDRDLRLKGCWNSTLDLCTDSRPKVRRRAQECVQEVLDVVSESGKPHPYAARTSEWAIKALEGVADSGSVSIGKAKAAAAAVAAAANAKATADTRPVFDKKTGKAQQPEVAALVRQQRQASGEAGASSGIWVCGFLKNLAPTMQRKYIAPLCTVLLRLPGLHNPFLSVAAFEVFEALFRPSRPTGAASTSADALAGPSASTSSKSHATSDTLLQTLQALTSPSLVPGPNDVQVIPPYLRALEGAMVAYARLDASKTFSRVPKLWADVMDLSLSARSKASRDSVQVRSAGRDALQSLVRYCVTDEAIEEACKGGSEIGDLASETEAAAAPLRRIVARMAETIGRQALSFNHSIAECLAVLTAIVSRLRYRPHSGPESAAQILVAPVLRIAAELRGQENFEHREQADALLGMAIEVCGPGHVLDLLPLGLLGENGPSVGGRAWLLQLLRTRITNTDLDHFVSFMVPLSEKIFVRRQEAEAALDPTTGKPTRAVEAKVYEALTEQIWACFPAYCDLALGVPEAMSPVFVELLANVLYTQVTLRPSVCRGLQVLVERNSTLAKSASPPEMLRATFRGLDQEAGKRNVAHLAELAPSLLAVFFNVFSSSPAESRGYVSECLASFLSITKPQDVRSTFSRVGDMLGGAMKELVPARDRETGPGSIPPTAHTMLDLLIAMIPFLGVEDCRALFERATADDLLRCDDAGVQKKAYRALARLVSAGKEGDAVLRGEASNVEGAAGAKVPGLLAKLREATTDLVPGAKRDRIALLAAIVPRIPSDSMHLLPQIIPEAVLATKEANQGSRELAYDLLVQMGRKMEAGGSVNRALVNSTGDDDDVEDGDADMANESSTDASVSEYLTMVAAGLAGTTPHMISATITSLARLVFEFKSDLPRCTLDELLSTLDVFLSSSNREILKSCLGFVKVAIVGLPVDLVDAHLPEMVKTMLGWPSEHRQHFKSKVRHIFERLIRRFGYERIESLTDEENKKLIRNIQKRKERARRKKGAAAEDGEEEEEEEENERGATTVGQRSLKKVGMDAFEEAIYGSESEISDEEDDEVQNSDRRGGAGLKGRAATTAAAAASRKLAGREGRRQKRGGEGAEEETYIMQDDDQPMDLLDRAAVAGGGIQTRGASSIGGPGGRRTMTTKASNLEANKARRAAAGDRFQTDDATGRMIINESDDEGAGVRGGGDAGTDYDAADVDVDGAGRAYMDRERGTGGLDLSGSRVRANKNNKRTRAEDVEMEMEQLQIEEAANAAAAAAAAKEGRSNSGQQDKKKQRREKETIGAEFRSKKGRGDVTKGGKDPYAYVPLAKVGGKKGRQGAGGTNIAFKGKKGRN